MRPTSAGGNVPPNFHQVEIPDGVQPSHQLQGYGAEGRIQVKLADLIGLIQGGGIDINNISFVTFNDETSDLPNSLYFATSDTIQFTQDGNTVIAEVIDFPDVNSTDILFSTNQVVLGRNSAGPGAGQELTASTVLDWLGATRGSILYRGASGWTILAPGTAGYALVSGGAGADPSYVAIVGKQTIYVPASAMLPATTNGPSIGHIETTTNKVNIPTLDFDAGTAESAWFTVKFPKSWNEGTILFRAFWTTTASDTDGVAISLAGVAVADNAALDVALGTAVIVTDDAQSGAAEQLITAESAAVTIGGTPTADKLCYMRVQRVVDDANDDMAEDLQLIGIEIIYTTDAPTDA